jgi:hypothetical protein
MVNLGSEIGSDIPAFEDQLGRLSKVFDYLSDNALPARQIFADSGKKIVVKTSRGS